MESEIMSYGLKFLFFIMISILHGCGRRHPYHLFIGDIMEVLKASTIEVLDIERP